MIVLFTVAVILTVLGMLATRYFVLRVERYSTNDMGDLFIFALTCATAALVGRLLSVRIEESLGQVRDSESRYRRIFENVQDVYYEMRTDGTLLELSPASTALFGVPREGMIGRTLAPFCVNRSEYDALLAAVCTNRGPGKAEAGTADGNSGGIVRTVASLHHRLPPTRLHQSRTTQGIAPEPLLRLVFFS
jgi:PAS domain-containing protein